MSYNTELLTQMRVLEERNLVAQREALEKQLQEHMRLQTRLQLTRRDGVTNVPDGAPLASLCIEGGVAHLPPFEA